MVLGGSERDSKKRKNSAERNLHRTIPAVLQTHDGHELNLDVVRQLHKRVKRRIRERFSRGFPARNHLKRVIGRVNRGKQHEPASLRLGLFQWNLPKHFGVLQGGLIAVEITNNSASDAESTFRIVRRREAGSREPARRRKCRACDPIERKFDRMGPERTGRARRLEGTASPAPRVNRDRGYRWRKSWR